MFRNYLKVTFRLLVKSKAFSIINITGLAIGLSACMLILQYVSFELSYDRFHESAQEIYRVENDRYQEGKLIQHGMITYSAVGKALNDDFEEIVENARMVPSDERIADVDGEKILVRDVLVVDKAFLNMFSFPLLAGDAETALNETNTVVISESQARTMFKYNGNDISSLLGKTFLLDSESTPYQVKSIVKDIPANSHLQFKMLISYSTLISNGWKEAEYDFTWSDFYHYVKLKPGTDYKTLETRFDEFSERHFRGNQVSGSVEKFFLQPLTEAHLYSDFEYEAGISGKASVVWGLLMIAVFILVIAWVNYINLATARAMERAKEVGMRKVSGAGRGQLIVQFLTESLGINLIAFILSIVIIQVVQPSFNSLLGQPLSVSLLLGLGFGGYVTTVVLVAVLVLGILLSGFYPAFVLSSFKPASVLKGNYGSSGRGIAMRKILVVGQFAATVALIAGSIIVYEQIRFINAKDLGVNIDQVLIVRPPSLTPLDSTFFDRLSNFKEEVKSISQVKAAATSQRIPGQEMPRSFNVKQQGTDISFTTRRFGIDYDFIDLFEIKILAGRKFQPEDYNLSYVALHNMIINQHASKLLGFESPEAAIGKQILIGRKTWDVVGVISDYHQKSLRNPLEPTVLLPLLGTDNFISLKVDTESLPQTIASVKEKFAEFFPGNFFEYEFLDDRFNQQYKDDQLFGKVFGLFAGFAIFIACLGLFALSAFVALLQTKAIGIRKVLGATVGSIVVMLSKDFLLLVLSSILIASPVAWWVMDKWLQDFAYRINIPWWVFVLAGGIALCIAMITVSFQSIKAALANPVKSLRSE